MVRKHFLSLLAGLLLSGAAMPATAQNTNVTYQGLLKDAGAAFTGQVDLEFSLYDADVGGSQIGLTLPANNVDVVDGLFTIEVDFGAAAFAGGARWLEIAVASPAGSGSFTTLAPRQPITAAPVALYALDGPGGGSLWEANGIDLFYDAGFVGIGTSSPAAPLHVTGDVRFDQDAWFYSASPFEIAHWSNTGLRIDPGALKLHLEAGNTTALTVNSVGNVGIGTDTPNFPLDVETSSNTAIRVTASGTYGVYSETTAAGGLGLYGFASATTETNYGVGGRSHGITGRGVYGVAGAASGENYGVYGLSNSTGGAGVYGLADAPNGVTYGGRFECASVSATAVYGHATAASGPARGVLGLTESTGGTGVYGAATATSGTARAVFGESRSPDGFAGYFEGGRSYFEGDVGFGTGTPLAPAHVTTVDQSLPGAALANEDFVVEDDDAVLGLYSSAGGAYGSVVSFGEVDAGALTDKWSIFRSTSNSANPRMGITYGSDPNYANNPTFLTITTAGSVGIGTTTPAADLHVSGGDGSVSVVIEADANNAGEGDQPSLTMTQDGGLVYSELGFFDTDNHFSIRTSDPNGLSHILLVPDGRVGVKTTTPSYDLEVNGTAGKPGGGSWTNSSDRRLKENINDLDNSLDRLMELRGVTFEYKDPDSINELDGTRIGMIAQEVEQVFPDWVGEGGHGYKTLTFRGFEALVVEALRELRQEKDRQLAERDAEIEKMRVEHDSEIAALSDRLARLESLVQRLAAN